MMWHSYHSEAALFAAAGWYQCGTNHIGGHNGTLNTATRTFPANTIE